MPYAFKYYKASDSYPRYTFRAALPSAPRWEHLKRLRLTGLGENRRFAATLIRNCSPDKLMAIDLSGTHSFLLSVDAQRHCNRLERLRLEHPFPPFNADSFPAMQHVYGMSESFPHVKWLSIVEKNYGREGNIDTFEQCFEQMTEALQQMPNLLRFAFTLDIDRFQPDEIRDRLGLDENDNEALTDSQMLEWYTGQIRRIAGAAPQLQEVCLFGNFGTSMGIDIAGIYHGDDNEPLTDDQVLDWYTARIQRIADAVPQMLEIYLFVHDRMYRGTKSDDGETMKVLPDAVQPGVGCSRFPWDLEDDDEHP
ncbi:hypothetical protein LRP88_07463 [Fusarium phalaenopsidis]